MMLELFDAGIKTVVPLLAGRKIGNFGRKEFEMMPVPSTKSFITFKRCRRIGQ